MKNNKHDPNNNRIEICIFKLFRQPSLIVTGVGVTLLGYGAYLLSNNSLYMIVAVASMMLFFLAIRLSIRALRELGTLGVSPKQAIQTGYDKCRQKTPIITRYGILIAYAGITALYIYDIYTIITHSLTGSGGQKIILLLSGIWPTVMTLVTNQIVDDALISPKDR